MQISKAALLASLAALVYAQPVTLFKRETNADKWRSQSIYQIVTDRFARTDGDTSASCNTEDRLYCGGSFQGIIKKLDYIKDMGFTAIWISPVVENIPDNTAYGYAYHGYWMKNIYKINENFGTADDLKSLAQELHDRDMLLMVDIVTNHYGSNGSGDSVDYSEYTPFNDQKYFHNYCLISNYDDQAQVQNCWEGDSSVALPDLRTEDSDVASVFNSWVKDFVGNYSIDGLRIDSAKHVNQGFFPDFVSASGVYSVGEVFQGDPAYTCPYQNYIPGVSNYPLYYPTTRFFKTTDSTSSELTQMISSVASSCSDPTLLTNFVENHDNERFASMTSDQSLISNAIAFVLLGDGIPVIYYGQEQGLSGKSDPNNREALWLSGYNKESDYYKLIAKANAARNAAVYQDSSYATSQLSVIFSNDHVIATKRGSVVSVFNNLGSSGSSDVTISNTGYSSGEDLVEVLTCSTVSGSSDLQVSIQGGQPQIFVPAKYASDICS